MNYLLIIIFVFCSFQINSQTNNLFESYIDSLNRTNGIIRFGDIKKFDTSNKETFMVYWLEACFKELKMSDIFYKIYGDVDRVKVHFQMKDGIIYNVKTENSNIDRKFNRYLKGYNFGQLIKSYSINGVCLYKVDKIFFNQYLEGYFDMPIEYGESVWRNCKC